MNKQKSDQKCARLKANLSCKTNEKKMLCFNIIATPKT